jgi:hypothetical protein
LEIKVMNRLARVTHLSLVSSALCFLALGHASGQTPPPVSFAAPRDIVPGQGTVALATADLNSDGNLDLITVNHTSNDVSVLLGNGDGTFQAAVNYPVVTSPIEVVTGDFNDDGKVDIAVLGASPSSTAVSILLGNGNGTFQPQKITPVSTSVALGAGFVAGDFNHDGKLDLATPIAGPQVGVFSVAVLPGKGDGTFGTPIDSSLTSQPSSIQSADFNGDGKIDLLVFSVGFSVLLGNGDGTFQPPLNSSTAVDNFGAIFSVAIGDFNRDGRPDAVLCVGETEMWVLLGNGDGTFQAPVKITLPNVASLLTSVDLDSDGNLDLVVTDGLTGVVQTMLGHGDGTFSPGSSYAGTYFGAAVTGDFDKDGVPDLALAGQSTSSATVAAGVSVALGNGDGTFVVATPHTIPLDSLSRFASVLSGDFDGDGLSDLAGLFFTPTSTGPGMPSGVAVVLNSSTGLQTTKVTNLTFPPVDDVSPGYSAVAGDFNGDGKLDLAVGSERVAVLVGKGDGTFQPEVDYSLAAPLALGDFNNDGMLDIIGLQGTSTSTVSVLPGKGDGTFGFPVNSDAGNIVPSSGGSLAVGDFNKDGKLDAVLLVSNGIGPTGYSVLLGNGDGSFQPPVVANAGLNPTFIASADMNGDGKLDLVITNSFGANSSPDTVSVLLGNGDGSFQTPITVNAGNGITWLLVSDINADGKPDVVIGNSSGDVSILVGNGDGTLQVPLVSFAAGAYGPIAPADFNGDGSIDLAAATFNGGALSTIYVLSNDSSGRAASLSPNTVAFGNEGVGSTSSAQSTTLTNRGTSAINIRSIGISGPQSADFQQTNTCGASLAAGASCSVSVTFSPSASGSRAAFLQIVDDAYNTPQTAALSGTGATTDFGLGVAPGGSASETVQAGGTAMYTLAIGGTGFSGTVALSCTGAPTGAQCSLPGTTSVSATSASNFTVNITTTARTTAQLTPFRPFRTPSSWLWAVALLGIILPTRRLGRRSVPRGIRMVPLVLVLFICSCGGGSSSSGSHSNQNGTRAGTYTITVNGSSHNLSQSIPITLIVQ